MGRTRWSLVLLLALLAPGGLVAQATGSIRGSVVDAATQRPLTRVQVTVTGTARGALSGEDGRFEIGGIPAGRHTVRASLPGYASRDQAVTVAAGGAATVSFALAQQAVALEGVVVTALGIQRQERTLTTATQQVRADELTGGQEANLVTALSGKVSGVSIVNSNTPGGSARIVIRGANSLTGNNQPLFVVDGIPVSNTAPGWSQGSSGYNAIDYGNAIQDLNPNDIQSVTVLKGPNAAALYGSRAANGAIIITTRSGRLARSEVSASSSVTFEQPLKLPDYQNRYGQGFSGRYAYEDGRGGGINDDTDESWGPRLDAGLMIPQFFSNGQPAPWVAHPDNVRDFFDTGRTLNTSAAFATSGDRSNLRLSLANLDQDGMYPGLRLRRTTLGLNGSATLSGKLRADGSVQYVNADGAQRPAQGYGGDNVMWQFLWFGRQVDTRLLRERQYNPDGSQFNWNSRWNNNPYWTALVNGNRDTRDRVVGSGSLAYQLAPWLSATLRSGTDWYEENRRQTYAAGTIGRPGVDDNGAFGETNIFRQETNTDFLLTGTWQQLGDFSLSANFGGNRRDERYRSNGYYVRDLVIPGLYDLNNSAVASPTLSDWREGQRVNSLYGSAQVGFRDFAFLEVTGRNDWSSTLPEAHNSYFYPSVSGSVVFSDVVRLPGVTYGKLRAGWAQVGSDASPYQLFDPYLADATFDGVPRYTASNRLRNFDLRPEETTAWEVGTEMRFLGDRLGVDLTYYDKLTSDQILPVQVSPMTGFTERMLNAGSVRNRGVELLLDAVPLRLANGFEWELTANYSRNRGRVESLYGDLKTLVLGSYYGVTIEARRGEEYGAMYGRKYVRDSQGNIVVGSNGLPLNSSSNPTGLLGNYNPDWTGGLSNRFSFRGVELSFLLDAQRGGSIYSLTSFYGRRSGVLAETAAGRCLPNPPTGSDYPKCDASNGIIVKGVRVVDGDTVPNDIVVGAQSYHRGFGSGASGLHEEFVFDASFVKLRELRLGYRLPERLTRPLRVSGMDLAIIGRNLALWSDVPHIDPETAFNAGNVQGFEYSQLPSARSIGFSISVTP